MMSKLTSDKLLRKMRNKIWDYEGTDKEEQAEKVLSYLKVRSMRHNKGLTYTNSNYANVMWM
jgi:hypothetical protein